MFVEHDDAKRKAEQQAQIAERGDGRDLSRAHGLGEGVIGNSADSGGCGEDQRQGAGGPEHCAGVGEQQHPGDGQHQEARDAKLCAGQRRRCHPGSKVAACEAKHPDQGEKGQRAEPRAAGAHDHQDACETDEDGQPALPTHALSQDQGRGSDDDEWRGLQDCRG
ncbi:hypothetical protein GALL_376480 [mine drainage metagenome]|uniref:Uncharacterized protein n=1 Tax=mine drainage metagenome TaxID=410659 RepID=A0A1J5QAC1_9ZZZZ